ncbi:MAG: cysteine synthase A [Clostridia bacterium]|nr:cysteine synthase A [Clostridia bacterium]
MAIYENIDALVGKTPLLALHRIESACDGMAHLYAKLECYNPASSAKDRIALAMIRDAEDKGLLQKGSTIIEPTSGNTGIGLAAIGAARGYRVVIVMPDSMSIERQKLMRAYGAEVVLTPGALGMKGSIEKAKLLAKEIGGSYIPDQFANPQNPTAHYLTTGPEIWADLDGKIDVLVAGIGTGGTVSGCARYLKEKNPAILVYGVEPAASPLLSQGHAGAHGIQGIGANFVPETLSRELLDEVLIVTEADAYDAARRMARCEGVLVGISSGAALSAAILLSKKEEFKDKNIVVVLPDTGEHYLSTPLFE